MKNGDSIIRVLDEKASGVFVIDCIKKTMPYWCEASSVSDYDICSEDELGFIARSEELSAAEKRIMHERYTLIAGVIPFVSDVNSRSMMIAKIAEQYKASKQTIRKYLCLYLVYQDISVLAPDKKEVNRELTADEKNIRWALNKFFYTKNKNSLKTAYTMMLKEKYCDSSHNLLPDYPSFYQFRYYYRKHRNLQKFYISRDGLSDYQRNSRPLTGNGIQEFASSVGIGMLDSTICDIYLVNESGGLIGRPLLTVCIDAYSSLCLGYTLSWEGGVYSLASLMTNVIADKQEWCSRFGISISKDEWNCNSIPATLVTDMGSEYKSETFEQIAEIGVSVVNLPPYRPELKGAVEKFFDLIQEMYKPYLKNRGVVEVDYRERGAHDYRKDACLTLEDFEKVILRCIIFYNTKRIIDNFPYTNDMLISNVKPYANCIWNYGKTQEAANLIDVDYKTLVLTLLPRAEGKFSRLGLRVNKLRYTHDGYTEEFLKGGSVTVAFNPDDVGSVWVIDKGSFIKFELIESQYKENTLLEIERMREKQNELIREAQEENLQAKIYLAGYIETIARNSKKMCDVNIKGIRNNRKKERAKTHVDYLRKDVALE